MVIDLTLPIYLALACIGLVITLAATVGFFILRKTIRSVKGLVSDLRSDLALKSAGRYRTIPVT